MNNSQKCYIILYHHVVVCVFMVGILYRVVVRMASVCGKGEQLERKEVVLSS